MDCILLGFNGRSVSIKKACKSAFLFLKKHWKKLCSEEFESLESAIKECFNEKQQKLINHELNKKKKVRRKGGFRKFLKQ